MADGEKGGEAEGEPTGTEAIGLYRSCRMTEVRRIEPNPDDECLEDVSAVTFAVDGPSANAEVEIMAVDAADIQVVAMALDTLHCWLAPT